MKLSSFRSLFPILLARTFSFSPFFYFFLAALSIFGDLAFLPAFLDFFFFFIGLSETGSIDDSIEFSTIEGVASRLTEDTDFWLMEGVASLTTFSDSIITDSPDDFFSITEIALASGVWVLTCYPLEASSGVGVAPILGSTSEDALTEIGLIELLAASDGGSIEAWF